MLIHIQRTLAFGDVLWMEPIVRHLLNEGNKVDVVTRYAEIFQNYPGNNLTVSSRLRKTHRRINKVRKFLGLAPNVIDLDKAYEKRPHMHVLEAYAEEAGLENFTLSYPKLYLTEEEKKDKIGEPYVVLHLEKNILNFRNVYGVEWTEVVQYVKSLGFKVIQISSTGTDIYGEWYKTNTLREVMSLIYNCSFFIGLDSGPSHIAAVFSKPALVFFGSVNPAYRHLNTFQGYFLQQPCEYAGCYHEVVNDKGQPCRLVGEAGIPKCSLHTTDSVINSIKKLTTNYKLNGKHQLFSS